MDVEAELRDIIGAYVIQLAALRAQVKALQAQAGEAKNMEAKRDVPEA